MNFGGRSCNVCGLAPLQGEISGPVSQAEACWDNTLANVIRGTGPLMETDDDARVRPTPYHPIPPGGAESIGNG